MSKPLSVDLRERVVAAVDGGLSRRKAAERFGVSISSAIRWASLRRRTGELRPKRQGGDKRSARIEAHGPLILSLMEARRDITLVELQAALAERGIAAAVSTIWRFFDRHGITLKKRPGMRPSRAVPTS
jgi:transposase